MYERHFGLKHRPFSIAPDPRYLFMSERHREALAHLLYGVQGGGGFVLLTGDVGAGKTTVCRCFLEQLPERCNVAYIFNPKLTVEELLMTVCAEFRIPYRHEGPGMPTVKDYVDALNQFLLRTHAVRQRSVLIIDEAQNLSADVLEQLRLLTNLETNERKLLQIILIGQPELREMLARPDMQQLAQRVIARYHLEALAESETAHYVRHRLSVAGLRQANPFDQRAMRRIFRHSRGVPRRINLLCDRALLGAYASGKGNVDRDTLDKAAEEALDLATPGTTGRTRYERASLIGVGLAVGALLVGAIGLALNRGEADAPRAAPVAETSPAVIAAAITPVTAPAEPVAAAAQPPEPARFDLRKGFASLVGAEKEAWQELAHVWGIATGDADPCAAAEKQQVRCYRTANATLTLVRQLDRPGVLTLRDAANRPAYVMLSGLSNDSATLNIDGVPHTVPLVVLADYWRGEFATFWRPPPDYAGSIVDSRAGPAAHWLAQQLATALGDTGPVGSRIDAAQLRSWIHRFQLAQGLPSDGSAGPITLMQLNRATGVDEPRLQKAT